MLKRKRLESHKAAINTTNSGDLSAQLSDEDTAIDIFASLTATKRGESKPKSRTDLEEDDDDQAIRDMASKQNKRDGTGIVKKLKGKAKVSKGEVGGGSFQSMGEYS